jgi:hypothetical protein
VLKLRDSILKELKTILLFNYNSSNSCVSVFIDCNLELDSFDIMHFKIFIINILHL